MRSFLLLTLVVFVALFFAACAARPRAAQPSDIEVIRSYGWPCSSPLPQPTWNPLNDKILVRAGGGFEVLDDTARTQAYFTNDARREAAFPQWLSSTQFVFGPRANMVKTGDGGRVPSSDGLTVVTLKGDKPSDRLLYKYGFRPRVGPRHVYAQIAEHMVRIDANGVMEELGIGFYPTPDRRSERLCWQETPVIEEDIWTGKAAGSHLVIQWGKGRISEVKRALDPRWTNDGKLLVTILREEPVIDPTFTKPWWAQGCDVVMIDGPEAAPRIIAPDAHGGSAHPTQPLIAVAGNDGAIRIVTRSGGEPTQLGEHGDNPEWNHDGSCLLYVKRDPAVGGNPFVQVLVLKFRAPAPATH